MKRTKLERRHAWLAAAVLALALLAGWWANRATEPEAPPVPVPPSPTGVPAAPPAGRLPPAQKAEAAPAAPGQAVDIFAVHTWEPPPPPMAAFVPSPPQAPPLPFRYMGRIADPGQPQVFLLVQGDRVLPVKLGDRVGGHYRLEKFEGGQLYFRYQPMNVVQTLPAGSAQ